MTAASTGGLRGNRELSIFWAAQAISRFGDPITLVVLAYVAYVRTGSALITAIAVLVTTLPIAIFGLSGGVIADALGYRRAMVGCDLLRAVLIAVLPILNTVGVPIWTLYLAVFASGLAGAVFNPARFAIIPSIVSESYLSEANALLVSTDRTVEILGALVAGGLVVALGPAAFYVDAATFGVSALILTQLRLQDRNASLTTADLLHSSLEGIRFLRNSALLWSNTIFSLVAQLSLPVVNGLTPVLLFRKFAIGNPELGAAQFAISEGMIAAGAVAGTLAIQPLSRMARKGTLLTMGFIAYGVALVLLSITPRFEVAILVFAMIGLTNVIFYVPNLTIAQELSPAPVRARVIGARIALVNLSWLPVIVLAGAVADSVPAEVLVGLAGAFTLIVGVTGALIPIVRNVP